MFVGLVFNLLGLFMFMNSSGSEMVRARAFVFGKFVVDIDGVLSGYVGV